jgi:nicotinate-nucleotide pyrophosphorylase (carboxylating)
MASMKYSTRLEVRRLLRDTVNRALEEDLGPGDVTSAFFGPSARGRAFFLARQDGVVSGMEAAREVFRQLDRSCRFEVLVADGCAFRKGTVLARVEARVAALLSGERTALNLLQQLSGVATLTRRFVKALGRNRHTGIYDTRKTTPLLRVLEKQAVMHGGGRNHRMGLFDMAMLKNNHIDAAGGVAAAVRRLAETGFYARKPRLQLCIEARDSREALEAMAARADILMLDNMGPSEVRETVKLVRAGARALNLPVPSIELSGGVTLKRMAQLRALPVDRISVGALTHSAPAVDISMRLEPAEQ